ncbi:SDR family NAD(P)-dependent oxidoreductase [Paenibacillus sp. MZ04-78.2]|uniref:SDR family NAD(P)-dependent oxidoreductase n=1 Tax=Paenibacillus sp. MZ04-78.2 TaxID=2962034 RepID=UPI0020B721BD|nr:SDR family NAD(P)-dependent oxidoreductase [Paenibacillus sp. MZ04-78.2]MCP3774464.1 SDR family NAD(P)-dependent oxidoreductase [Paenibacillus sp. MZ04-78.2]
MHSISRGTDWIVKLLVSGTSIRKNAAAQTKARADRTFLQVLSALAAFYGAAAENVEMLEVQLINVTAPFLINTKLKDAMLRSPHRNRFIVNVSASEGRFNMKRKGGYHVHTNMAKASLNMMTLTMSKEYKKHRIFITSVDPGWVSNQFPDQVKNDRKIQLPLDFDDAAARICDPIYEGKDVERPLTGVFLKDFRQVEW